MNHQDIISGNTVSFKEFLFQNKRNKITLWVALFAIIIQFIVFKYFYPYASYIHGDSFSYLTAAYHNLTINTYPIGYSKFLRLISVFLKSDLALTTLQYLLIQSSVLLLLFTLFYFYKPGKIVQYLLLCFMVFNPLFWHLANMVSSDNFFLSLSMVWLTLLLWIINRPSNKIILVQALVMFFAFTVRYNALLYPLFGSVVFLIAKMSIRKKILGIASGILLCCLFILFTSSKYKRLTGHWQYSPFSGWQWANNAMYAYRYIDSSDRKPVPKRFTALDNMIRQYFDSTRDTNKYPTEAVMASSYYMWSGGMPLMKYREHLFKNDSSAGELKKWASMGPFYKDYGLHLIKQYPFEFLRYFIIPNASKYYAPPIEFLQSYNWNKDSVPTVVQAWFGYKSGKVTTRNRDKTVRVLDYYPILSGVINVIMLSCIVCFVLLRGWKHSGIFKNVVFLISTFWLINALFTIGASPAALRFQAFPLMLTTTFIFLFIDWMVQLMSKMKEEEISIKSKEVLYGSTTTNEVLG